MGVIKNEVGRPSNKTLMVRSILRFLGVLIIVGGVVWISYNLKDAKEERNSKKTEEKSILEEVSIEEGKELLDNTFSNWKIMLTEFGYEVFNTDGYKTLSAVVNTSEIPKNEMRNIISKNYKIKVNEDAMAEKEYIDLDGYDFYFYSAYKLEDVNKTFNKLFKKGKLSIDKVMENWDGAHHIIYIPESNVFVNGSSEGNYANMIINDVYSVNKENNKLYVTVVNEMPYHEQKLEREFLLLQNGKKIFLDFEIDNTEKINKILEENKEYMHKYQFIFEKADGNYKFVEAKDIN